MVAFAATEAAPRVAGLFAEGRIDTGEAQALTVPEGALQRAGELAQVWRVADGKLHKVAVKVGDRDPRSGEYPVLSGLAGRRPHPAQSGQFRRRGPGLRDGHAGGPGQRRGLGPGDEVR
jgi:hypothetical protein